MQQAGSHIRSPIETIDFHPVYSDSYFSKPLKSEIEEVLENCGKLKQSPIDAKTKVSVFLNLWVSWLSKIL